MPVVAGGMEYYVARVYPLLLGLSYVAQVVRELILVKIVRNGPQGIGIWAWQAGLVQKLVPSLDVGVHSDGTTFDLTQVPSLTLCRWARKRPVQVSQNLKGESGASVLSLQAKKTVKIVRETGKLQPWGEMVEQMCNSPEMKNVESREIGCDELTYSHEVFLIGQPETPRVYLKVQLNGKVARGLLDTGSERNILH